MKKYTYALLALPVLAIVIFSKCTTPTGATQTNALSKAEAKAGCDAIAHIPNSIYKQTLLDLAAFAVTRSF